MLGFLGWISYHWPEWWKKYSFDQGNLVAKKRGSIENGLKIFPLFFLFFWFNGFLLLKGDGVRRGNGGSLALVMICELIDFRIIYFFYHVDKFGTEGHLSNSDDIAGIKDEYTFWQTNWWFFRYLDPSCRCHYFEYFDRSFWFGSSDQHGGLAVKIHSCTYTRERGLWGVTGSMVEFDILHNVVWVKNSLDLFLLPFLFSFLSLKPYKRVEVINK